LFPSTAEVHLHKQGNHTQHRSQNITHSTSMDILIKKIISSNAIYRHPDNKLLYVKQLPNPMCTVLTEDLEATPIISLFCTKGPLFQIKFHILKVKGESRT